MSASRYPHVNEGPRKQTRGGPQRPSSSNRRAAKGAAEAGSLGQFPVCADERPITQPCPLQTGTSCINLIEKQKSLERKAGATKREPDAPMDVRAPARFDEEFPAIPQT